MRATAGSPQELELGRVAPLNSSTVKEGIMLHTLKRAGGSVIVPS